MSNRYPSTIDHLEEMWVEADEDFNAAMDANDQAAAARAVMRQEIIADLIDEILKF